MKLGFILLIALLGSNYLGCRQESGNAVRPQTAQAHPTASTDIVRTENGTMIKQSGWQMPTSLPEEKHYTANIVVVDGRKVTVLNSPFFPDEKLLVRFPKLREDGDVEYEVSQIIEFSDERKRPYCYQFVASDDLRDAADHPYVPTFFSYLDDDGDGVFETLGEGCKVPGWVK